MANTRLKHRIELQRKRAGVKDFEPSHNWTKYGDAWADRIDSKGDDVVGALQTRSEMTTVFRTHWRPDVKVSDRVIFRERVFDIKAATSRDDRERWLMLHCTEHFSDGG